MQHTLMLHLDRLLILELFGFELLRELPILESCLERCPEVPSLASKACSGGILAPRCIDDDLPRTGEAMHTNNTQSLPH